MIKQVVFLYNSTIKPWHTDIQIVQRYLTGLQDKGVTCEPIDTKDMSEEELKRWREKAQSVAMRYKQQMSQHFGSRRRGGFPYFGRQVPALLVYEDEKVPTAVYPHTKKRGQEKTDYSIEAFLKELADSLGG